VTARYHFLILTCVLALAACGKKEPAPADQATAENKAAEGIGVELSADEQAKLGVATASLSASRYQGAIDGQGSVLDVQPIAQALADLTTAEAAVNASEAALKRAEGLYKADTSISQEALESARQKAVADEASLALAKTKATIASGPDAPWLDAKKRQTILRKLTAGSAVVVKTGFPSGISGGEESTLTVRKVGGAPSAPSWRAGIVWTGPSDPSVPGPTLYGYIDDAKGLAQGDHVVASLSTGKSVDGVVVPASAVVIAGGQAWCYAVEDNDDFTRVPLDLDRPTGDGYFQPNGAQEALKPGAKIVVTGGGLLLARETGGGEEED
jgi:membrane fusion protein, multidrug efflux system